MGKFTDRVLQDLAEIKLEIAYIKKHHDSMTPKLQSLEDDVKFAKRMSKLVLTLTGLFFGWMKLNG